MKKRSHLPKGVIDGNDPRLRRSRIVSFQEGERANGEIRSWQFNGERKEEIRGKREKVGIGFNSI